MTRVLLVAMLLAFPPTLSAGEGHRVVFRSDFELDHLPLAREYDLEVFGWRQHHFTGFPKLMAAEAPVDGGAGAHGRVMRLPIGGGRAWLTSLRNPSRFPVGERSGSERHFPVAPGELLTVSARFRHDDLRSGRLEFSIRFAFASDPETGAPEFTEGPGPELVHLRTLKGGSIPWTAVRGEVIVPDGAVGWRLELLLDATRERMAGSLEVDDFEVLASPRFVLRWADPLRRVAARDVEPMSIRSIGLPTGDYTVDLVVIDDRGEVFRYEELSRYVDDDHPIHLLPDGAFLTGGEVPRRRGFALDARDAGMRYLVVKLKDARGDLVLEREVPYLTGEPPFTVGRGRSRHGVIVPDPVPDWIAALGAYPAALVVDASTIGWPLELRDVPEVRRAAITALVDGDVEKTMDAVGHLWSSIPRWYLDPPPVDASVLAELSARARDLRIGVAGEGTGFPSGVPLLRTITPGAEAVVGRCAARFVGASFGDDPVEWTIALFRLDAAGATDVYITDPEVSLFRRSRQPGEGFAPRETLLAWQFSRGFLGGARYDGREEWREDIDCLFFRHGDRDAVALIARGDAFDARPLTLQVSGSPRAFDAIGRKVELPPVEDGRLTIDGASFGGGGAWGRFLLIEGVDLSLERTVRSFEVEAIDGGFRLTATNALPGVTTLEPRLDLPRGYRLLSSIEKRTLDPGETAQWDIAVELPPSAGIAGTEFLRGDLIVRDGSGEARRLPFERILPIECTRLEIMLVEATATEVTVALENRSADPVLFHLYLQATPKGRGERTITGEALAVGETREYVLPLEEVPVGASGRSSLWVGVTFTDGERGYCNRTFRLPSGN